MKMNSYEVTRTVHNDQTNSGALAFFAHDNIWPSLQFVPLKSHCSCFWLGYNKVKIDCLIVQCNAVTGRFSLKILSAFALKAP